MPRSSKPQVRFRMTEESCALCFFAEEAWSVKTATPTVTARTTRYLYSGKERRKRVICKNMTGSSLQDFARMNVM